MNIMIYRTGYKVKHLNTGAIYFVSHVIVSGYRLSIEMDTGEIIPAHELLVIQ
jgi:hypothetical protein